MHKVQGYVDQVLRHSAPGSQLKNIALNGLQCQALKQRVASDAVDYVFSGAFSIGEAVQGLVRGHYTWATVKLYYASFYLFRALLGVNGICLIYDGSKPLLWSLMPGELPRKGKDTTHKVILAEVRRSAVAPVLTSQPIDLIDPLLWLATKRESANYGTPKFVEPQVPDHFEEIKKIGVRRAVLAYLKDSSFLYAFDADHAMLAYPIEVLKEFLRQASGQVSYRLSPIDWALIASLYLDDTGPIPVSSYLAQ